MATRKKIINKSKKDKKGKKRNGNKNVININVNSNNKKIGGSGGGNSGGGKKSVYIPPYLPNPLINPVPPKDKDKEKKDDMSNFLIGYVEKNNLLLENKINQTHLQLKNDINSTTTTNNNFMLQDMNTLYGGINNLKLYLKQQEEENDKYLQPKSKHEDKYMAFKKDETERLRDEKDPYIETDPYAHEKLTVDNSKITHDIEVIETEESLEAGYIDKNKDAFVGDNPSLMTTIVPVDDTSLALDKVDDTSLDKVDDTSSVVDKKVGEKKTSFFTKFFNPNLKTTPHKKSDDIKDKKFMIRKKNEEKNNEPVPVIEDIKDTIIPEETIKKKKKKLIKIDDSYIFNAKEPEPEPEQVIKRSPIRIKERINLDDIGGKPTKELVNSFIEKLEKYAKSKKQIDPEDLATYRFYVGMQSAGGSRIGPAGAIKNLKSKWNL